MAYTFFRWFRTGIAAALVEPPPAGSTARRAKTAVGVDVAGVDGAGTRIPAPPASVALDIAGPADVSGIDGRQVIRTFPAAGSLDCEPAYLAHVEFDRPDLPWLFTPFGPDRLRVLRPWICLVVVERGDEAKIGPVLPPTLTVTGGEVARLPAIDQVHAWAHVQVTGEASDLEGITLNEPERIVARLVCPRPLDPDTDYYACVVPTFKLGALAGLGRDVPAETSLDAPAWTSGDQTVELPVYYSWEFTTGGTGDFESLVLRLRPRSGLPGVGTRPLDITDPGFGLPARTPPVTVPAGGVFRTAEPADPADPADPAFAADLEPVLNAAGTVGPPIYGRWHAAVTAVSAQHPGGWPDELNLDPRHRVAAGLGAQVVRERQEDLMAAVWQQCGEIIRANQLLRQGQLAVGASERVAARHLGPLPDPALLAVAGPALARTRASAARTARKAVADSCLPLAAVSGAFRRVARVQGPLERRLGPLRGDSFPDQRPGPAVDVGSLLPRLAAGSLAAAPVRLPPGAVPLPAVPGRSPRRPERPPGDDGRWPEPVQDLAGTFAQLADRAAAPGCTPLDTGALAGAVRAALAPGDAVAGRVRAQVAVPASDRVRLSPRLDPIMAAPEIPTPMIGPLVELGPQWLLPGISEVPQNTITIVTPDARFIEAYLVGLNHEMGRELLWRGFPTDQRGTVFARFWDRRGSVATATVPLPERDIAAIHQWRDEQGNPTGLGTNMDHGAPALVVLLIRGDLLQRYPRATIYAQQARWKRDRSGGDIVFENGRALREPVPLPDDDGWEQHARFPVFQGQALGNVTFLGFPLAPEEMRGIDPRQATANAADADAGWFVVFAEQPTEPRFGGAPPDGARSDELASLLLKPAFRLFVHGRDLVHP